MQLQSLNISGFKSFAKTTPLSFAPGITAIVGPNGCGKSNVVDAIRWVLGEQRSSVLRGERMDNVIFNGTASRKGAGLAEVKLVMDNTAGRLNVPYTEVEIARRLHRDGTSEYLLNGNDCRLKDITDMLHDSGMGPNLYTILELKMVEEILREDGEGRRTLFEEAAGVAKYKIRRRQALAKLKQTDDDLLRLSDIITEVERQVSSLKRQSLRARRYSELSAQSRAVETALAYRNYIRLKEELDPLESAIRETSVATEAARSAVRREEARLAELRTSELEIERETAEARKNLSAVVAQISTMEAEEARLRAKDQAAREAIDRARRERLMLTEKREVLHERLADHRRIKNVHEAELAEAQQQLDSAEEHLRDKETEAAQVEFEVKNHQDHVQTLRQTLSHRQRDHGQIIVHQAGLVSRRELLQKDLETMSSERAAAVARLETLGHERDGLLGQETDTRASETELVERVKDITERLRELEDELRRLSTLEEASRSRLELLRTLENKGPRADAALKTLRDAGVSGLLHLLGDTVDVEDRYKRAVQAALGPVAYSYITEDTESALAAVVTLRRESAGQAMFVPVSDHQWNGVYQGDIPREAIGMAMDLVREGPLSGVLRAFLGRVLVVESWDMAVNLRNWAIEHGCIVVTLDGQWISSTGLLRGGSEDIRVPVDLGLGKQISDLESTLESAGKDRGDLQNRIRERRVELSGAEQHMMSIRHRLDQLQQQSIQIRDQQIKLETMIDGIERREQGASSQLIQIERDLSASRGELDSAQKRVDEAEADLRQGESSGGDLTSRLAIVKSEVDRRRETRHNAERGRDSVGHRLELVAADIARIDASLLELTETLATSDKHAEDAANEITGLGQRLQELEVSLVERFRQRDDLAQLTDKTASRLDEVRNQIAEQDEKLRAQREAQAGELEGERRIELEIARLHGEIDALLVNVREQLGLDLSASDFADAHQEELGVEASAELFQEIKQKIERLGPVNLLAVEEYEQENARLELMLKQREDLLQAKKTLQDTIARINETAQAHFLHTFEAVRTHFQRLFQEFFPAGEADLILSGTDLLEADITLWANPSGKRLKSMSLMSGGEKTMTAIALLFALYQVKPSPFCVFDEVDAPLDDANIDRFNRVIRMHSQHTQFILVTHNRRTMEIADNLYGVTMEEEGISKIVSVRLLSAVA